MIKCIFGKYCFIFGFWILIGDCIVGYYCFESFILFQQVDCSVGYYCFIGSGFLEFCRNGIYGFIIRFQSDVQCIFCDGGMYCNGIGFSVVIGFCDFGFYCFSGQFVFNFYDYRCLFGYYCLINISISIRCFSGFFQNEYEKDFCKVCLEGKYII